VQTGSVHTVPSAYIEQPPTPSHRPVCPQVAVPWSLQILCGSAVPMSIGQQTPARSGRLQETQAPAQAELQQTPSAQNVERQSSFLEHFAPGMRLPQLPVASQAWPSEHWAVELQLSKQAPLLASQENGAQIIVGPGRHWPLPSHTPTPTRAAPWQVPGLQVVPGW
jgi:hypothetical protein